MLGIIDLDWLIHSTGGLAVRVAAGVAIFLALALVDLRRNGRQARRWREYLFLLAAVLSAMLYGIVNDQITVTISPEYFLYAKGGYLKIGQEPTQAMLRLEAVKIGMQATWTAGLIFGVALLFANNPRKTVPQLSSRELLKLLPVPLMMAAIFGLLLGLAGYAGMYSRWLSYILDPPIWRPMRFMAVWGIHLGGYVGGTLGTILAVWLTLRKRSRLAAAAQVAQPLNA